MLYHVIISLRSFLGIITLYLFIDLIRNGETFGLQLTKYKNY